MDKPGFLSRLLFGDPDRPIAVELYGGVVAIARRPHLYSALRVPDTPAGRYEMVVLHLALLNRRLAAAGAPGTQLARLVNEAFVVDMDDCMRELGTGDLAVPKRVKRAAVGLYERLELVGKGLAEGPAELESALSPLLPGVDTAGLARHLDAVAAVLERTPFDRLARGEIPTLLDGSERS